MKPVVAATLICLVQIISSTSLASEPLPPSYSHWNLPNKSVLGLVNEELVANTNKACKRITHVCYFSP